MKDLMEHLRKKFLVEEIDAVMQAHPTIFKSSEIGTELSTYASVHKDALEKVRRGARFQYKRPGYPGPGHSTPGRRLSDTSRVSANKIRISIFSSVRSVNGAHGIRALEDIAEVTTPKPT
jgi:hypothetical protein